MGIPEGTTFLCPQCGRHYFLKHFDPAKRYRCRVCHSLIEASAFAPSEPATEAPLPEDAYIAQQNPSNCQGRYVVLEELGRGGMSTVRKAWDTHLPRYVALKFLRDDLRLPPQEIDRFKREAGITAQLNHPNLVIIHDFVTEPRRFIVMDFVDGQTFAKIAWDSPRHAVKDFIPACPGVGAAHRQNIVHRDLKPRNLMRRSDGTVVVLDFGLARVLTSARRENMEPGIPFGTPGYMSPEQALGQIEEVGARSDVYSLGVTLYVMIAGRHPRPARSLDEAVRLATKRFPRLGKARPGIPKRLDAIVQKATAVDPNDRYASADELADALEAFLRTPEPPPRKLPSDFLILTAAVIVLIAAVGLGVVWRVPRRLPETAPAPEPIVVSRETEDPWAAIARARSRAEATDTSEDWQRVVNATRDVRLEQDKEAARRVLDEAFERRDYAAVREAEKAGKLDLAIAIARSELNRKKSDRLAEVLDRLETKKERLKKYDDAMKAGEEKLMVSKADEAEEKFVEALEAKPGDPAARDGLKRARLALGARAFGPSFEEGKRFAAEKRWVEAKISLTRALDARPGDPEATKLFDAVDRQCRLQPPDR